MKKLLALLLFIPNLAFAQVTQQQILNSISSNLPTNNANQISALALRNTLNLMTTGIFEQGSGTVNPVIFGADPTCTNDSTSALNQALAISNNVIFPPGCFKFLSNISYTLPTSAVGAATISGSGADVTELRFPNGNGITVHYTNAQHGLNAFNFEKLSCTTSRTNVGICLTLLATSPIVTNGGVPPSSSIRDVNCRGSDGYGITFTWNICFLVENISNVIFDNDYCIGNNGLPYGTGNVPSYLGTCIYLRGTGGNVAPSAIYNLSNVQANQLAVGLIYSDNIQGVTIVNSNFTADSIGVWVPPATQQFLGQLSITNSQFGLPTGGKGVYLQTCTDAVLIQNNLFIIASSPSDNIYGIGINQECQNRSVFSGNEFEAPTGGIGISIGPNTPSPPDANPQTNVVGNLFYNLTVGMGLQVNSANVTVTANRFVANGTAFSNSSAAISNLVYGNAGVNQGYGSFYAGDTFASTVQGSGYTSSGGLTNYLTIVSPQTAATAFVLGNSNDPTIYTRGTKFRWQDIGASTDYLNYNQTNSNAWTFNSSIFGKTFSFTSPNPLTGTNSGISINQVNIGVDEYNAGSGVVDGLSIYHNFGTSAAQGGRQGFQVTLEHTSPTNGSNANRNYVGMQVDVFSDFGDGGGIGTEKGLYFGGSFLVTAAATATRLAEMSTQENNTLLLSGSSVLAKYGYKIVQLATDAVQGSVNDAAFFAGNVNGAIGWKVLFQVGDGVNASPLASTGTIMSIKGSPTIANGIDLSGAGTISSSAFKSPSFNVDGSGNTTALTFISTGGSVPGSGSSVVLHYATNIGFLDAASWGASGRLLAIQSLSGGGVSIGTSTDSGATNLLVAGKITSNNGFISGGTVPTGNTGTCSTGVTVAGGSTAGTWTSTAICATGGTIILTAMPAAPTGYACFMTDRTTNGVTVQQTATSTTSATFTVRTLPTGSIATVANDILQYSCMGY